MKRFLTFLALVLPACGGSSGGGALAGDWEGDSTLEYTIDGTPGSIGGYGLWTISAEGDGFLVDDGVCAYPAVDNGDDTLSFAADDGCMRTLDTGPMRLSVTDGSGSLNGRYVNLDLSGTLSAVSGSATGTFSLVFRGEPYAGR